MRTIRCGAPRHRSWRSASEPVRYWAGLRWTRTPRRCERIAHWAVARAEFALAADAGLRRDEHDLGAVASMPLTIGGFAHYNIANLAAAALAAGALGIRRRRSAVYARFGTNVDDNPGRMMRYQIGGCTSCSTMPTTRGPARLPRGRRTVRGGAARLGLLLGHAGNRQDRDIEDLARSAVRTELGSGQGFRRPARLCPRRDTADHSRGVAARRGGRVVAAYGHDRDRGRRVRAELARPGDVLGLLVHAPGAACRRARDAEGSTAACRLTAVRTARRRLPISGGLAPRSSPANPSSSSTGMPSSRARVSLEPASAPATR